MICFDYFMISLAVLYILGSVCMLGGLLLRGQLLQRTALALTVIGFVLHTVLLLAQISGLAQTDVPRGLFGQVFAWMLLLLYFIIWRFARSSFLGFAVAPVALLAYLFSYAIPSDVVPPVIKGLFGVIHIGSLACSAALAAIAAIAGILFIYMNNKLKLKAKLSEFDRDMPALSVFDKINHYAVFVGFPLFTVGMFAGFFNAGRLWGATLSGDPKELISIVVWLIYAFWFYARLFRNLRGRKAAFLAIFIFILCALSMFGVNLLMNTHHSFRA